MDEARIERGETSNNFKQENNGGEVVKIIRGLIKVLLIMVMLGYLFMWLSMPTDIYRDEWRHTIGDSIKSTYFGKQGLLLLMYVFPPLFVATLGCVYLHLGKKYLYNRIPRKEEKTTKWLATLRRPLLVRGPLGIVSGIELSFLMMFIAILVWSFTTFLQGYYAKIEVHGSERWLYKWERTVFTMGKTGNICLTLLFYPVTRGSSVLSFLGLTSESSIKYHMWLGHLTIALASAHGLGFLLYWAVSGDMSQAWEWNTTDVARIAGEVTLFFGLIIWIGTFSRIRRKFFEVFFYTHNLYIIFVIFFFFHVGNRFAYYMLPGFYLFMIDRYLRFLQSRQRVRLVSARVLPCDALELNFAKSTNLCFNPNSIMFVNVPSISKIQWHPFTVASSSNLEPHKLSVVIKVQGKWTRKLYDTLSSPSSIDHLQVSVEGPYGPTSNHLLRHDKLVLVSGGSGITPFISMIQELLYASTRMKCETPKIVLISIFKRSCDLSMLNLLLPCSGTSSDLSSLDLQIKAYITQEKEEQATEDYLKQSPQTISFKPNESDSPISPSLGTNSWLWLGAIIASSFMGYLIFMGLLTQYYIYPIDQNTAEIFNWSTTTVYYFLIICGCIGVTASGAFLWNKKQNSKQIMNMEGITPEATPQSQFNNADNREIESLPLQSILNSTQVNYGQRPDLKKLLFECEGSSSVGVLVSGPHGLRHEVAAICGAGLVENLYFESISFSW